MFRHSPNKSGPRGAVVALAAMAAIAAACSPASAAPYSREHAAQRHDFHGRDFFSFSASERAVWGRGLWRQDWHDGRFGWWWIVDGSWYLYPAPIYPYPTYAAPSVVVQAMPPTPSGMPPAQQWYFCDNPQGYYPYVASCNSPWREVPATPPAASAPPR
ncbi:MAG TPA: hypothetical protein VG735_16205 [Caulobacterales bacterium]|nr:hypothetical protein [Caulobacterales bacterium]